MSTLPYSRVLTRTHTHVLTRTTTWTIPLDNFRRPARSTSAPLSRMPTVASPACLTSDLDVSYHMLHASAHKMTREALKRDVANSAKCSLVLSLRVHHDEQRPSGKSP